MDGTIKPEQHSCCAAQVLHELVEKLSVEDTGVYLLLPLATTPMLIENLVHCIVNKSGRDYSLTHSLTYSLTHSLTYSLTYSLTHSLTHSLTYLLTHSLTYSLTHSLTHSFTYSLTYLLTCISVGRSKTIVREIYKFFDQTLCGS